jgi:hypothetical protein
MMNNEEIPRNTPYQQGRKPMANKYYETRGYPSDNRYGQNSGYNSYNSYNNGGGYGPGQHQRRRIERFRRDPVNYSEKLVRQNDLIIRLLKEIRDRLPAPAVSSQQAELDAINQGGHYEYADRVENGRIEQPEQPVEMNNQPEEADPIDDSPENG